MGQLSNNSLATCVGQLTCHERADIVRGSCGSQSQHPNHRPADQCLPENPNPNLPLWRLSTDMLWSKAFKTRHPKLESLG